MASYFKPSERVQARVLSNPVDVWRMWDDVAKKYTESKFVKSGYKQWMTFLLDVDGEQVEWTVAQSLVDEVSKHVPLVQGAFINVRWDTNTKRWEVSGIEQTLADVQASNLLRRDNSDLVTWKAELLKALGETRKQVVEAGALLDYLVNLVEGV